MSFCHEYKRKSDQIQLFLGELGHQLERVTGFVQRTSQLTGSKLVQILVLSALEQNTSSLRGLCRVAEELGVVISEAGLHQRLNGSAVELLRQVSQIWMVQTSQARMKAIFAPFDHVHIIDSTEIRLPDSMQSVFRGTRSAASLKVQLAYEYKSGHVAALDVEAGCQPDQKSPLVERVAHAGDLVLFDLGYFDQKRFARLHAQEVSFVSRLHIQAGLYSSSDSQQAVTLLDIVRGTQTNGEGRYYLGSRERVPVRVLYYRLPDDIIAQRRRKAHDTARRCGKTCSQSLLASLEWLVFVTNAPPALLTLEQVAEVYRLRWQVEVVFKVWKSGLQIAVVGTWRPERVLVHFYARLLAVQLFHGILELIPPDPSYELSLMQAAQLLRVNSSRLIRVVQRSFWGLRAFLIDFIAQLQRFATKTKRRKHPSTLARLRLVGA